MARKTRNAFTLVEMLVVIAIIGMLMAMVLPAIQSAQEMGRMNTCKNNMRQIGLATIAYAELRKEFPGYINRVGTKPARRGEIKMASWVVMLLPQMSRSDMWDIWNSAAPQSFAGRDPIFMENLVCPSDVPEDRQLTQLSYVVNCGTEDRNSIKGEDTRLRPRAIFSEDEKRERRRVTKANGIFQNHYRSDQNEDDWATIKVTTDYVESGDGTSYTMLISENIQAKNWSVEDHDNSGRSDVEGYEDSHQLEKYVGFIWGDNVLAINRSKDSLDEAESPRFARPSSNHGGGVNVVMCDNSTHFISEGIDPTVYNQLMTPNHRESMAPNRMDTRNILNDGDW